MKKQITIKEFRKLNNTFDKMDILISWIQEGKRINFHADVLRDNLEAAKNFWVDLYKRKGE